jgi:hypothetical protein
MVYSIKCLPQITEDRNCMFLIVKGNIDVPVVHEFNYWMKGGMVGTKTELLTRK